jgi:hypothetical protein
MILVLGPDALAAGGRDRRGPIHRSQPPGEPPDELADLQVVADRLEGRDLTGLTAGLRAERILVLRRMVDQLEGCWLKELAGVDACGAAGLSRVCGRPRRPAGCATGCG